MRQCLGHIRYEDVAWTAGTESRRHGDVTRVSTPTVRCAPVESYCVFVVDWSCSGQCDGRTRDDIGNAGLGSLSPAELAEAAVVSEVGIALFLKTSDTLHAPLLCRLVCELPRNSTRGNIS